MNNDEKSYFIIRTNYFVTLMTVHIYDAYNIINDLVNIENIERSVCVCICIKNYFFYEKILFFG